MTAMVALEVVKASDLLWRASSCIEQAEAGSSSNPPRRFLSSCFARFAQLAQAFLPKNLMTARVLRRFAKEIDVLQYLQRVAASDDERRSGNWEVAKYLLQSSRFKESGDSGAPLRTALIAATESTDPHIKFHAAAALARVLFACREYSESLAAAALALSVSPSDPRALRSKANAFVALGRIQEARQIYTWIMTQHESTEAKTKLRALEGLPEDICPNRRTRPVESRTRLLVGIGGGIGDILHTTPTLRNIAERTGSRIDVVVFADSPGAEFLVQSSRYVDRVFPVCPEVFDRSYETVFLSHSFGPLRFPFHAKRILASEDWRSFRPGALPETIFNLEAVKRLLGVPFEERDTCKYFVADLELQPRAEMLVGFHSGSKSGRWLSKRWPHFPELGRRLIARGIRVASFGTSDEYVPGTEDRTGGSIEEMCRSMLDCTHFISNDSGAMHIASALKIPVLALFAPTDPYTHLPLRASTASLVLKKSCAPCEVKDHRHFASGSCRCVAEIDAGSVERKVLEMVWK